MAHTPTLWGRITGALRRAWAGESYDGPGYPVDPLDLYDGLKGVEWMAGALRRVLRRGGRGGGPQQPTTLTDQRVRELARLLEKYNPYAQGMLSALRSYTLGDKGLQVEVVCKPGDKPDNALRCQAQAYLDEFRDREDWWSREREVYTRAHRDGEATLRFFYSADTGVRVRPVEPECIVPPNAEPEWSGGVKTDPDDAETKEAIHVEQLAGEGEEVPFAEVYMIACNTDRCEKRGVSDFASVAPLLQEAIDLVRTMLQAEAERQSIVLVTHHKDSTPADVEAHIAALANYTPQAPAAGAVADTVPTQFKRGGVRERHLSGNQELATFPDPKAVPSAIDAVNTALLAVGVRYHMPLWVISGDASRNNALDLGAEGPFGRFIADEQQWYCRHVRNVLWRVIQIGVEEGDLDEDVLEAVDLTVSPQRPAEKRDPKQETERLALLNEKGVMGLPTWAAKEGLDFEAEQNDIKRYPPPGSPAPGNPAAPGIPAPSPGANGNGHGKNYFESAGGDGSESQPRRGKWRLVEESGTGVLAEFDEGVGDDLLWAGEAQTRGQPGNAGQFGPGGGGGKKDPKKGKAKKEKEEKPTVAAMVEHIAGLRAGKPTAAHLSDLADKLGKMTVKDLHVLKTQLGGKGGKTKPEVVAKIQAAVTGTPAAKPPAAKKAPAGKAPPAAEPPAAPPPGHLTAVMSMFRDMGGDRGSDDAKDVGRLREGAQMLAPGMTDADFAAAAEHLRSRGVDLPPVAPAAAAKKPPAAKPPAAGKPTVEGMAQHIAGLRAAGPPTAAHLDDLAQKLTAMTVKDLHTLKTQLGGKGGKVKAEVVAKIKAAVAGAR